jgi:hypothetical protein
MPHTEGKRYAVRTACVSCHVERLLDDACFSLLGGLLARPPGGFPVALLVRPPDPAAGEEERRWLARARALAEWGPLGHHTHFLSATRARPPAPGPEHARRVRREAAWLRERGLQPRFFCGGGWYMDEEVAEAVAELGYADCTATAFRPAYLPAAAPRLELARPTWLRLPSGRLLLELPATHSLGMAARASLLGPLPAYVHVYFHDTDLLRPWRRRALQLALAVLARRCRPLALSELRAAGETDFRAAFGP